MTWLEDKQITDPDECLAYAKGREAGLLESANITAVKEATNSIFYEQGFAEGLRKAAEIAFDIEAKYAPRENNDCCKCNVSHAKADGAAECVNAIQAFIKKEKK